MAWRFVRQPNGKVARWSDVVDGFTDYDMRRKDCIWFCMQDYDMSFRAAEDKVDQCDEPGRWEECIRLIKEVHGQKEYERAMLEMGIGTESESEQERVTHTPGPWRISPGGHNILYDRFGERPQMVASVYVANDPSPTFKDRAELEANARLVASAPDLLKALAGILEIGKRDMSNPKYNDYFDAARQAIVKATGEPITD